VKKQPAQLHSELISLYRRAKLAVLFVI